MDVIARLRHVFSDRPLVESAAFALFYEQTHATVFRYVYMLHGGPQADAEDSTAEAFTRAWNHRHRFTGSQEAALGWVITIARRIVLDQHRRQRSFWKLGTALKSEPAPGPEQQILLRERQQVALTMLAQLSLAQRDLVIMRYFLGWRVQEIARQLGLSDGAVSVRLHRALRALQVQQAHFVEGMDP